MTTASGTDEETAGPAGWAGAARLLRRCVGVSIVALGTGVAVREIAAVLTRFDPIVTSALVGGSIAAGATALGTLPVALSRRISRRANSMMLGFGAGVMLAASIFSLIIPALALTRGGGASAWTAGLLVSLAIACGAAFMLGLGRAFGHARFHGPADPPADAVRRAWLFVTAITLHNIPEGAAIGVAFAGMDRAGAVGLATGIAIQDIPEGLAVALALRAVGRGRSFAVGGGIASGLVEPLFAALGAAVVTTSVALLPGALAAAAGAMLFVIANDVIPESHKEGQGTPASLALMLGFTVMLVLDTALA